MAGVGAISVDKSYLLQEWITPLERRLYFTTAHTHFLAGCPALALEVLSKLPDHVQQPDMETEDDSDKTSNGIEIYLSSTYSGDSYVLCHHSGQARNLVEEKASEFDWSTPVVGQEAKAEALDFDWSKPLNGKEDKFELKWSDDEDNVDSDDSEEGIVMKKTAKVETPAAAAAPPPVQRTDSEQETGGLDIMAQQLKFIACLKILMGEMATLATGFEVDGGQLRLQLYLWLDRELQVSDLRDFLCDFEIK